MSVKLYAKAILKAAALRLPVSYAAWAGLDLFRHGRNDRPTYAVETFAKHWTLCAPRSGFRMLELGPGDGLASAVLARAFGGNGSIMVDAGPFATQDMARYGEIAEAAAGRGLARVEIVAGETLPAMLDRLNAIYLTEGLVSLRTIPAASVDFAFSHSVLPLVRREDLAHVVQELRRVAKPGTAQTHRLDFECSLDRGRRSYRFSDRFWESALVARSGSYTNRVQPSELIGMFGQAGFAVEVIETNAVAMAPLGPRHFAPRFRDVSPEDLQTGGMMIRCVAT